MSNTLPILSHNGLLQIGAYNKDFYYPPKDCFHLVIDYPSFEKDAAFQQQVELLDRVGGSMGLLIGNYLTMPLDQRLDETQLEYRIVQEITEFAQALVDSIETSWNADLNDYVPDDPDDNFAYAHASQSIYGGYDDPLTAWNMARKLMPLFNYYYSHIVLPEDMDIYEDWDYDLNVYGDMAIIQFKSPDNLAFLRNMII